MFSLYIFIGPHFALFPPPIDHAFLSKTASKMTFDFNMPSERAHFELPENLTFQTHIMAVQSTTYIRLSGVHEHNHSCTSDAIINNKVF